MQQAILAIEDNRFYNHGALDLQGTIRAVINNATGRPTQGGSSITQQLVKLTLVQQARTQEEIEAATEPSIARKIRELKLATQYEKTHSKDEILERYLNIAYYGDGAYGIDAAARHWFSTSAADLTTNQAALLAGVVKNPSYYDPKRSPERATQRRNTVLAVMAKQGKISAADAQRLMAEPLGLKITAFAAGCASASNNAAFACDYVRRFLLQEPALGQNVAERAAVLERGGLTIESTIDPMMQRDDSQRGHVHRGADRPRDRRPGPDRARHRQGARRGAVTADGPRPRSRPVLHQLRRADGLRRLGRVPGRFDVQVVHDGGRAGEGHQGQQDLQRAQAPDDPRPHLPHLHRRRRRRPVAGRQLHGQRQDEHVQRPAQVGEHLLRPARA